MWRWSRHGPGQGSTARLSCRRSRNKRDLGGGPTARSTSTGIWRTRRVARKLLVDTAYFVSLIDPRDDLNPRALAIADVLADEGANMSTTDAVVLELANYFARSPLRATAAEWIATLRDDPQWVIEPIERDLLLRAETRYRRHA